MPILGLVVLVVIVVGLTIKFIYRKRHKCVRPDIEHQLLNSGQDLKSGSQPSDVRQEQTEQLIGDGASVDSVDSGNATGDEGITDNAALPPAVTPSDIEIAIPVGTQNVVIEQREPIITRLVVTV